MPSCPELRYHAEMGSDRTKLLGGCVVVAILIFGAYKVLHTSYESFVFLGDKYEHFEVFSSDDYVETHFFTIGGVDFRGAERMIQITNIAANVTNAQRTTIDNRLKAQMRFKPLPGSHDQLFGVFAGAAVYVLMLERSYLFYMVEAGQQDPEVLKADAKKIIAELEYIPIPEMD